MINLLKNILIFSIITLSNYINIIYITNSENLKNNINIKTNNINKWNYHKNMLYKIKKFKVNGIITYKSGINKFFIKFYLYNINTNKFKFKAYTYFGIKLIDFIFSYNNIKNKNTIFNKNNFFEEYFIKNIPIENINSWLIGLPGNAKKFIYDNKLGYLKEVYFTHNSNKLNIKYHKYLNNIIPPMPIKIELNQNNKNKIYLNINNWLLLK
ncbi:lipoprotein insertase outer membrane protein LolB [Candidatus Nardonella dryophthoridicola]|uniref:Outer-membrane lipoprotein LolB n=1 Tax=endosymbiont of Rhynchophorus ferrugineus TaxID=1972133 RepID=A0A2Z5T809_9GAMM|nr:lipoprotein insertase outer membrane protein LolB [Candidatus Nardonella dryophthoridicola]QTJ62899.1 hypothetical protein JRY34_00070 [Candidatus Nardonella dryophthoridicola]BBA85145.1 outer-membrane lipoprotein LolB [endosymbiont of Rhynchophorus ferrugineus]